MSIDEFEGSRTGSIAPDVDRFGQTIMAEALAASPELRGIRRFFITGDVSYIPKTHAKTIQDIEHSLGLPENAAPPLPTDSVGYEALNLYRNAILPGLATTAQLHVMNYPVFSLTESCFAALTLTDFTDDVDTPLQFPYHAFMLTFPPSMWLGGASRCIISRVPRVDGSRVVWAYQQIALCNERAAFSRWGADTSRKDIASELFDRPTSAAHGTPLQSTAALHMRRARQLLCNFLSYLETSGPLPTSRRIRGAAPAAVERVHRERPVFEVGRTIRLNPSIRRVLDAVAAGTTGADERLHLASRFIVRGHWRNQAHGTGRQLRKRLWIEPHWKGPENVEAALSRSYTVDFTPDGDSQE